MSGPSQRSDLQARKALGRSYLNENRVEDALRVYANILREDPQDLEAYLFLGDCYLADGDGQTAAMLYGQALDLAPDSVEAQRRVRLAQAEMGKLDLPLGQSVPTDARSIADLLQKITGRGTPISEDEVNRAAQLLEEIVHCPHPAQAVAEQMQEIDELLPALVELNIRQAAADGRPDLARALQNLLGNINLQLSRQSATPPASPVVFPSRPLRVRFLQSAGGKASARHALAAAAMNGAGCDAKFIEHATPDLFEDVDVVVVTRPHCDPRQMEIMAACSARHIPMVLDLEMDFEQLPVDAPDYDICGLGTPARAKAYASALLLADAVCVPSQSMANALQSSGYPAVHWIPDGWTRGNGLWDKQVQHRHMIHLGWMGNPGQVEDAALIRRVVLRVMREFQNTRLVVSGDLDVYQLFDSLAESRRLYNPPVQAEDFPYLLSQIDVLMIPLRNTPFNRTLSDRPLMEAGIRSIPWIASPIPAFAEWKSGGVIAGSVDDWYTQLRQLVMDSTLRASLGWAGRQQAESRETSRIARLWLEVLRGLKVQV